MFTNSRLFDYNWDVNKYKSNYDPEYWDLCKTFMESHKTKYPEQRLTQLTEAFYQIGVYGSSYDAKTTRMVSALAVEVLESYLLTHPGALKHPFKKTAEEMSEVIDITRDEDSPQDNVTKSANGQPSTTSDKDIDTSIIVNILQPSQLQTLLNGFVILYDVKSTSIINSDRVSILEDSFKRSKFGSLLWEKKETTNKICPIRMALKLKSTVIAEAEGADEKALKVRLAQAVHTKLCTFCHGIEARWVYFRDGKIPDNFRLGKTKKNDVYTFVIQTQFKSNEEVLSYIDTFANSDSYVELVFGVDFRAKEKGEIIEHVTKFWSTKLAYRVIYSNSERSKNSQRYICIYRLHTVEDLKRWLEKTKNKNEKYRMVRPNDHRRAAAIDRNIREVLTIANSAGELARIGNDYMDTSEIEKRKAEEAKKAEQKRKEEEEKKRKEEEKRRKEEETRRKEEQDKKRKEAENKKRKEAEDRKRKIDQDKRKKEEEDKKRKQEEDRKKKLEEDRKRKQGEDKKGKVEQDNKREEEAKKIAEKNKKMENESIVNQNLKKTIEQCQEISGDDLEKLLDGFVLFYDAKKNSEIDKDDWFSALRESFRLSKFGPLEVFCENLRPMRTRCVFIWNNKILASAEGLTETQVKTAATLQLISKLEPFTYIIQAKEEYFFGGKVPPFLESSDANKNHTYRTVRRQDLPTYYSIFQCIDEFVSKKSYEEVIFGNDFSWELKNEIVVYIKAKGLDYRYFTTGNQEPSTHMAIYHMICPQDLKDHLLANGGENEKYKLILPPKAEAISNKPAEVDVVKDKPVTNTSSSSVKVAEKRKHPESSTAETESNKIQINLKKFKMDKVDYPEDTGGEFPGLILWVNIKKNSTLQRSMFCVLLESFKMSKFGELLVEESEETVWGKKEPLKKCVIKANRKVLGVGMGESKTEAKTSASLQVLRQLRKDCYTIQAKETYFKEGKATPYDFEPDPVKEDVYRLARRNKFKDRASIIRFVDAFFKNSASHEVIFGNDFTYDEREAILLHCRQIKLEYRLMKCQSTGRVAHTHIAIFHQKPLPVLKATLIETGGENDMYRLIQPGAKIPAQNSQSDMWPESLETGTSDQMTSVPPSTITQVQHSVSGSSSLNPINTPTVLITGQEQLKNKSLQNETISSSNQENVPLYNNPNLQQLGTTVSYVPQQQFTTPPVVYGQPHPDMPLAFGQQPNIGYISDQTIFMTVQPDVAQDQPVPGGMLAQHESVVTNAEGDNSATSTQNTIDLREELIKKRQSESVTENKPERTVYNTSEDKRVVTKNKEDENTWARKVFVNESEVDNKDKSNRGRSPDLRQKLKGKRSRGRSSERTSPDHKRNRNMSDRERKEIPPRRDYRRITPDYQRNRKMSDRDHKEISPRRDYKEDKLERARSRERLRSPVWQRETEGIRGERGTSYERIRDRYSPASQTRNRMSPSVLRDERRRERSVSPTTHFRDLWDNIAQELAADIIMYKYVKQDSTTERDPILLLQATKAFHFNIDFEFVKRQVAIDKWQAFIELVTDYSSVQPLVGEGEAPTLQEAKLIAAYHAVDTLQKACRVIEPNYHYFMEGGEPDFIIRRNPRKTHIYEIIQNMDPDNPLDTYTIGVMFKMFLASKLEDLFFLVPDFSYAERLLVIEVASDMGLWWRLFGPRHPDARPDDVVSTQHVCVFKQKSALQLMQELLDNNGSTEKYALVNPLENRITKSGLKPRPRELLY